MSFALSEFDYTLPPRLIAQEPSSERSQSRLMIVKALGEEIEHHVFSDLVDVLRPHDLLVVNRTQVINARIRSQKPSGGKVEFLVCRPRCGHQYAGEKEVVAMAKPLKAMKPGAVFLVGDTELKVVERREREVVLRCEAPWLEVFEQYGELPLPPYIRRDEGLRRSDAERYQTVFAKEPGAVAAPTASLHFNEALLSTLKNKGVKRAEVLLHVGRGTFLPIPDECADDVRDHSMHSEYYEVPQATIDKMREARRMGGRVISVGTTSTRALETWAKTKEASGESQLFIYPGYRFSAIDGMITNFHLPKSTLLMMVSALVGKNRIRQAYSEAIKREYRFFSYGDAMLLWR